MATRYAVLIAPGAERELKKLKADSRTAIFEALEKLAQEPRPNGVEKISQDPRFWRHRVGEYRVIYHVDDARKVVAICLIRDRKDAYKNLDVVGIRLAGFNWASLLAGANKTPPAPQPTPIARSGSN